MGLDLTVIALCVILALLYAAFVPGQARTWVLLVMSVGAVYILQPALPIRFSDFILPTSAIGLALLGWWATLAPEQTPTREDVLALGVTLLVIVGMSLFRFVEPQLRLTPSRPPDPLHLVLALALLLALVTLPTRSRPRPLIPFVLLALVALFVVVKTEALAAAAGGVWRGATGQDVSLAGMPDWNWLGFSYLAFRIIHTLRDRQSGLLPALSLRDYLAYSLFFPSYTAGPIDRVERFQADLAALPALRGLDAARFAEGGGRIALGIFKKFVIADTLAAGMALTTTNAVQASDTFMLWLLLYGYALRLYFDFSGYTDIAIGIGILFGVRLPENFARPYLKTDITRFWQSWHKTLSDWARFYVFSPLSRALLRRKAAPTWVVFVALMATMLTIGVWHGVAGGFIVWGAWHGVGLFAHKQWSDRTRRWYRAHTPVQRRVWTVFAWFITFHFVVLGWVWFALPDAELALGTFARLFGVGWAS